MAGTIAWSTRGSNKDMKTKAHQNRWQNQKRFAWRLRAMWQELGFRFGWFLAGLLGEDTR